MSIEVMQKLENSIYYNYINLFYRIALFTTNLYGNSNYKGDDIRDDYTVCLMDTLLLAKRFYLKNHLKGPNIIDLLCEGTLKTHKAEKYIVTGKCVTEDKKENINVVLNNSLFDGITLIHELSHYKDKDKNENMVRQLFTEALAFTEERLYVDFLEEEGYEIKDIWNRRLNRIVSSTMFLFYKTLKIANLYKEVGSVTEDAYYNYYCDNTNYYEIGSTALSHIHDIIRFCMYTFALAVSQYIYDRIKKGELSIDILNLLHEEKMDLTKTLSTIGLEELLDNNIEKLVEVLEKYYIDYEGLVMKS